MTDEGAPSCDLIRECIASLSPWFYCDIIEYKFVIKYDSIAQVCNKIVILLTAVHRNIIEQKVVMNWDQISIL